MLGHDRTFCREAAGYGWRGGAWANWIPGQAVTADEHRTPHGGSAQNPPIQLYGPSLRLSSSHADHVMRDVRQNDAFGGYWAGGRWWSVPGCAVSKAQRQEGGRA